MKPDRRRLKSSTIRAKPVKYVEIGWLVKDKQGQEYLAGSVPASESTMLLPSRDSARSFCRIRR